MTRVKVIYASKHGATHEIAEAIADELRTAGLAAECLDAGDVRELDCDAVILGSAVYAGRWRHTARHILSHHARELAEMPFWLFSSGPIGDPAAQTEADDRWLEPHKVIDRAEELGLRGHVVFGGVVPQDPHNFVERAMLRNTPEAFQDRRDWDEIRAWSRTVASELRALPAHT